MSNDGRVRDEMEQVPPAGGADEHEHEEEHGPSLLELLIAQGTQPSRALASRILGVVVGRVEHVEASGAARVSFQGAPPEGFAARAMVPLGPQDQGREVALLFEGGDPEKPMVMGMICSPLASSDDADVEARADGRRVEIAADEEIVLRCGDASITLTRAGKIILRGAYVLSRSSGVNRIQGGSVEIN